MDSPVISGPLPVSPNKLDYLLSITDDVEHKYTGSVTKTGNMMADEPVFGHYHAGFPTGGRSLAPSASRGRPRTPRTPTQSEMIRGDREDGGISMTTDSSSRLEGDQRKAKIRDICMKQNYDDIRQIQGALTDLQQVIRQADGISPRDSAHMIDECSRISQFWNQRAKDLIESWADQLLETQELQKTIGQLEYNHGRTIDSLKSDKTKLEHASRVHESNANKLKDEVSKLVKDIQRISSLKENEVPYLRAMGAFFEKITDEIESREGLFSIFENSPYETSGLDESDKTKALHQLLEKKVSATAYSVSDLSSRLEGSVLPSPFSPSIDSQRQYQEATTESPMEDVSNNVKAIVVDPQEDQSHVSSAGEANPENNTGKTGENYFRSVWSDNRTDGNKWAGTGPSGNQAMDTNGNHGQHPVQPSIGSTGPTQRPSAPEFVPGYDHRGFVPNGSVGNHNFGGPNMSGPNMGGSNVSSLGPSGGGASNFGGSKFHFNGGPNRLPIAVAPNRDGPPRGPRRHGNGFASNSGGLRPQASEFRPERQQNFQLPQAQQQQGPAAFNHTQHNTHHIGHNNNGHHGLHNNQHFNHRPNGGGVLGGGMGNLNIGNHMGNGPSGPMGFTTQTPGRFGMPGAKMNSGFTPTGPRNQFPQVGNHRGHKSMPFSYPFQNQVPPTGPKLLTYHNDTTSNVSTNQGRVHENRASSMNTGFGGPNMNGHHGNHGNQSRSYKSSSDRSSATLSSLGLTPTQSTALVPVLPDNIGHEVVEPFRKACENLYDLIKSWVNQYADCADETFANGNSGSPVSEYRELWSALTAAYRPLTADQARSYVSLHLNDHFFRQCLISRILIDYIVYRAWDVAAWYGYSPSADSTLREIICALDDTTAPPALQQTVLDRRSKFVVALTEASDYPAFARTRVDLIADDMRRMLTPLINSSADRYSALAGVRPLAEATWTAATAVNGSRVQWIFQFPETGVRYSANSMLPIFPDMAPAQLQAAHWRVALVVSPIITVRLDTASGIRVASVLNADVVCMQ